MNIRRKRIIQNLTMQQLAEKSGVSRVALTRYELGQRVPNVTIASRIASALGCTVDDLLHEPPGEKDSQTG